MSNDEDRAALHQVVHALLDDLLRAGIDGGGGLIQDQHRGIGAGGTGDVEKLPLALAEAAAVTGEDSLIALGQVADELIGAGQMGGGLHLLIRCVQTAVADVIGHGAGKEVGILEHHAQRPAKGILLDVPHVDAVVGNGAALDLVEAVDEAGDGGLACAGGADKGDLLPRLCKEGHIVEDGLALIVAKDHMVETDVAPEGGQFPVRLFPGPGAGLEGGLGEGAVPALHHPHQLHLALVHLGLRLHDLEDALGAGHGGEDGVHLLGDLVDGLAHLLGVVEEGSKTAQVAAADGQQSAHAAGDGIVHMGEVAHGGGHDAGEGLGIGAGLAVDLVEFMELLHGGVFVVKDLDDLLALDHLLDVAVDLAHRLLLGREVPTAPAADELHRQHHDRQHAKGDKGQRGAQDDHHGDGANKGEGAGHQASEAVVQCLGDGLDVVGIAAHELAVGVGIEVLQGQALHLLKEVLPDLGHRVLGHMDHDAGVAVGAGGACDIHKGHEKEHFRKACKVAGEDIVVDEGL